ncbi:hypothetical protein [Erythrobacter donghaensis]|nr:hypothetical protein [Erythrobacter donghaensis]
MVSASDRIAMSEMDGDNDPLSIDLGNLATFIEDDSDAASARRFKRRQLP